MKFIFALLFGVMATSAPAGSAPLSLRSIGPEPAR